MKRITIFVGHYGSGKTEVAVNYAFKLKEEGKQVIIVDLDLVNPYYRTKDVEEKLKEQGIEVISPIFANTNVDLPSMPPELLKVFADKSKYIVFDVGGDDDGATALGTFFNYFMQDDYEMIGIINNKRPLTNTPDDIILMLNAICINSRLQMTGIVNNANLSYETNLDIILDGEKTVKDVCTKTGIPFKFTSLKEEFLKEYLKKSDGPVFPIKKYLSLPWQI